MTQLIKCDSCGATGTEVDGFVFVDMVVVPMVEGFREQKSMWGGDLCAVCWENLTEQLRVTLEGMGKWNVENVS